MGRWVHNHATTTILVATEFRELADFLGHSETTNDVKVQWLRPKTHMEWFPHPLHTYKVFETIHMLWMGRWVHHHAITTILVRPKFRELADFLGHSKATNDARVD
jgi:hypothetical protein